MIVILDTIELKQIFNSLGCVSIRILIIVFVRFLKYFVVYYRAVNRNRITGQLTGYLQIPVNRF